MHPIRRFLFATTMPAAIMSLAAPVEAGAPDPARGFDIPAQTLAAALDQFAHQAGVQLLYPYAYAAARRSAPLHAALPPRHALEHLLRDSGLTIARYANGVVLLKPAPVVAARKQPAPQLVRPRLATPPPAPDPRSQEDIIVTGRASGTALSPEEASYAITRFDADMLARRGPGSTADLFKEVPGFWVESTGGEASNNIRARGIPTDGYSSVAILEDGLPVQYDGGLGYLNTDQVVRSDATIDRVEAVRGGPSAIFAPNAPGGSIDFLTRNPLTRPGTSLSVTGGSTGYRRIDGFVGLRLTPRLGVSLGGFYRRDDGLRDPGYPADRGGQIRAGITYDDGRNRLSFNVKHLDDRVILYLPVPLQLDSAGNVAAIPGFDPLRDTLAGPANVHVAFKTPTGPQDFDLSQGTHSRITFYTASSHVALGGHSALEIKARLRTGSTLRNGLFPVGRPMTGDAYIASVWPQLAAGFPTAASAALRYADTGATFLPGSNGNGLVVGANLLSIRLPMREFIGDARLTSRWHAVGEHDLAFGLTYADSRLGFARSMGTVLLDVRGQARRLDVVALGADGRQVGALTDNGFVRYGSLFDNATLRTANVALYAGDEWRVSPHWRIDLGARWERTRIHGGVEGSNAVNLGDPATLADDAVLTGNGIVAPIDRHFSGFNATLGVNYHPRPGLGLFARVTSIARLPSATDFTSDPQRSDEAPVPITMAEAGVTLRRPHWHVQAVGFGTHFARLPFTDYRFDPATSAYTNQTSIADTSAIGLELMGHADVAGPLQLDVQATLQDPRYRNFRYTELTNGVAVAHDASGNQLIRVPRLALRATPSLVLLAERVRVGVDIIHYSARFADIANSQRLPPFSLVNIHASARVNDHLMVTLNGTNLTNALGLTEGNPRMGSFDAGGMSGGYFLARPEFGRTLRATVNLTY
ncbi:TonB-dependent receptor [Novosphingobium sp.]|uniref:TonB-dependent receptor n=1 Tax=Novosphingobium sp. TaxID=1874826 RepID=UPI0031D4D192